MQALFENRHQQVNRNRDSDLGAHGVLAGAIERFDAQVLLDPFEEQFDVPATVVKLRKVRQAASRRAHSFATGGSFELSLSCV